MIYGAVSLVLNVVAATLYYLSGSSPNPPPFLLGLRECALLLVIAAFVTGCAGIVRDRRRLIAAVSTLVALLIFWSYDGPAPTYANDLWPAGLHAPKENVA